MDLLGIVVAGLVGTVVVTALMYAGPLIRMPKVDIAQVIGSMALHPGRTAFAMGILVHLVMGIVFAGVYAAVWNGFDNNVTWWSGLVFGAVHANIAAASLAMVITTHKEVKSWRPTSLLLGGARGMTGMIMGHLLYGLIVAMVYGTYV